MIDVWSKWRIISLFSQCWFLNENINKLIGRGSSITWRAENDYQIECIRFLLMDTWKDWCLFILTVAIIWLGTRTTNELQDINKSLLKTVFVELQNNITVNFVRLYICIEKLINSFTYALYWFLLYSVELKLWKLKTEERFEITCIENEVAKQTELHSMCIPSLIK